MIWCFVSVICFFIDEQPSFHLFLLTPADFSVFVTLRFVDTFIDFAVKIIRPCHK